MRPSSRLLWLAGLWAALGFAASSWSPLVWVWAGCGGGLLLLASRDAWRLYGQPPLQLQRSVPAICALGQWQTVTLKLDNPTEQSWVLQLIDGYPAQWEMRALPRALRLSPATQLSVRYQLRPLQRGDATFSPAHLRLASPWGWWQRSLRLGNSETVRVFPDFARVMKAQLLATEQRLPQSGLPRKRPRGEGTDFHQLREYRHGDSVRTIDWKATARLQKPISREYQEERDQQVIFLLDCGRRMLARDGELAHFDHALNALLLLAWVAQKQGDAVGILSFGQEQRWLPPRKGRAGLDRLLAGIYDLQPGEQAPDYQQAAETLLSKIRKRALVILLTNLRDEDDQSLSSAIHLLSRKHLVLCASLRETVLDQTLDTPLGDFPAALRLAACHDYLQQRQEACRHLGLQRGMLLDVTPAQLATTLVSQYRQIKDAGVL